MKIQKVLDLVLDFNDANAPEGDWLSTFHHLNDSYNQDSYVQWCIHDRVDECDFESQDEYEIDKREAVTAINNELRRICPDIGDHEEVVILIWW